jgi:ATP-dependent exoDNAse (exonuclease V) beta subunit
VLAAIRRPDARGNAREAARVAAPRALPERIADLSALQCRGARAATYERARKAAELAALEELAAADRDLLQELLERFSEEYAAAKRRESVVDFEDLQLAARDLLRDDLVVREAARLRFRLVMVDGSRTQPLAVRTIDIIAVPTEVFTVSDEFQSSTASATQ